MHWQKVAVVGGGAWGTALAHAASSAGRDVLLWAHEPDTAAAINSGENTVYLPGIRLNSSIHATASMAEISGSDIVLLVTPAQFIRQTAELLAPYLEDGTSVVICAKGIEQKSGALLSHVLEEVLPGAIIAVLSGPSFAAEVAQNMPTAITIACENEEVGRQLASHIGHISFRPYWSNDIIGTQIGGSIKNVLAIATGIAAGKKLGASAHAALTTRGFAEMLRFGNAFGAREETMRGLSGLGDLILTCSNRQSRNMSLGYELGKGANLAELMEGRKSVTEGVYTAAAVARHAEKLQIEMPICNAVYQIVNGNISVDAAIDKLLSRPFKAE
jgi:glycerol-3-phosphate dehydrogenase (NAD(P)+)